MSNQEQVSDLFNNKRYSAYDIYLKLGIGIKEVYHYISLCEVAKHNRKTQLKKNRELV